ncbi:MAG: transposase [Hyphomicrobiales bacterium]|nr:transposase [Hyphomicrobiales bacterium]
MTNGHAVDLARVERFARRMFSDEDKRAMVLETEQPGATVSSVARRHDIVPSMLFRWRAQLGLAKEKPARLVDVSTTGKGGKSSSAAAVLHDLLVAPAGMTLVDLPDGRRVFAPAGADPDAVQRHVDDWSAAS